MVYINRVDLVSQCNQYVWVYGQAGFGKTILLKQHYDICLGEKLWIDSKTKDYKMLFTHFMQKKDTTDSCLYVDDIQTFEINWLSEFF
jgi:predicted ATPase